MSVTEAAQFSKGETLASRRRKFLIFCWQNSLTFEQAVAQIRRQSLIDTTLTDEAQRLMLKREYRDVKKEMVSTRREKLKQMLALKMSAKEMASECLKNGWVQSTSFEAAYSLVRQEISRKIVPEMTAEDAAEAPMAKVIFKKQQERLMKNALVEAEVSTNPFAKVALWTLAQNSSKNIAVVDGVDVSGKITLSEKDKGDLASMAASAIIEHARAVREGRALPPPPPREIERGEEKREPEEEIEERDEKAELA